MHFPKKVNGYARRRRRVIGTRCSDPNDPNDCVPASAAANRFAGLSRGDSLGFKMWSRESEETDPRDLSLNESLVHVHCGVALSS